VNSDEAIAAMRMSGFIADSDVDFTPARLLIELYNAFSMGVDVGSGRTLSPSSAVVQARQGYWQKRRITQTVAGRATYRIPDRAVAGGLEKLELRITGQSWVTLDEVTPQRANYVEGIATTTATPPCCFLLNGDQVVLLPAPAGVYDLRWTYYLRPSRVVTQQSVSPTQRGIILAVNTTARTITVNVVPFDQELALPAAITSALQRIDVVRATGWHELALVGATQTLAATTFTVGGADDMSEIEVGDYVRAAEQTDWPCLPDEHHRMLCDLAASVYARSKTFPELQASLLAGAADSMREMRRLLEPRVKSQPRKIVREPDMAVPYGMRRWWWT
jgi:hypothetical protein